MGTAGGGSLRVWRDPLKTRWWAIKWTCVPSTLMRIFQGSIATPKGQLCTMGGSVFLTHFYLWKGQPTEQSKMLKRWSRATSMRSQTLSFGDFKGCLWTTCHPPFRKSEFNVPSARAHLSGNDARRNLTDAQETAQWVAGPCFTEKMLASLLGPLLFNYLELLLIQVGQHPEILWFGFPQTSVFNVGW